MLFPALRIAYMICPAALVDRFGAVRAPHGALALQHVQVAAHRRDGRIHQFAQLLKGGKLHPEQVPLDPLLPFFGLHYLS